MNIKNCPFCGDKAYLTSIHGGIFCDDDEVVVVMVECRGCSARSSYRPAKYVRDVEIEEKESQAARTVVDLWNARCHQEAE